MNKSTEVSSVKKSTRNHIHKDRLRMIEAFTKNIAHEYFAGNLNVWFDALHKDCIWSGSGEPTLFGADNIQNHFHSYERMPTATIINESYIPLSLSSTSFLVSGHITIGTDSDTPTTVCFLTIAYRISGNAPKIMYQHMSYDFIGQTHSMSDSMKSKDQTMPLDISSRLFIRQMLLNKSQYVPIAVSVGTQTYFIDPNTIIYLQSDGHRTNLYCIDKVINCSMLITEIQPMLKDNFYPLRRGCIINSMYITAIRRCEVELIFGTVISIPVPNYTTVKRELQELIGRE